MLTKDVVLNILLTMADGSPGWTDWLERAADRIMAAGRAGGVAPEEGPEDLGGEALAAAIGEIGALEKRLGGDDPVDRLSTRVRCLELAVDVRCAPNGTDLDTVKLACEFEQYVLGTVTVDVTGGIGGGSA